MTAWVGRLPSHLFCEIWKFFTARKLRVLGRASRACRAWALRALRARAVCFVCTHSGSRDNGTGRVHAVGMDAGAPLWSDVHAVPRGGAACAPAYCAKSDVLYLCDINGIVRALRGRTGATRWEANLGHPVEQTSLLLHRGRLLVRTLEGRVACLCPRRGAVLWWTAHQPGSRSMWNCSPVPSTSGKMVYFVDGYSQLVGARLSTGAVAWRTAEAGAGHYSQFLMCRTPVVGAGRLWTMGMYWPYWTRGDHEGGRELYSALLCLDSNTGRVAWMHDMGYETFTLRLCPRRGGRTKGGMLLVGLAWGLEARSPRTGAALWTFRANHLSQGVPVLSHTHNLILMAEWFSGKVHAVRLDGTLVWTTEREHQCVCSSMVCGADVVVCITESHGMYAHNLADGSVRWYREDITSSKQRQHCHGEVATTCVL